MPTDQELKNIYAQIAGTHKGAGEETRDEEGQRVFIAKALQHLMQNTDPMTFMSMLVVALAFLCDEHGVNRDHVVNLFREAKQRHALIVDPSGRPT